MPRIMHFADGPATMYRPPEPAAQPKEPQHVKLTSEADDFIETLRESIARGMRLNGASSSDALWNSEYEISLGLFHCIENHQRAFEYACREMGIPATIQAVAGLSTEEE